MANPNLKNVLLAQARALERVGDGTDASLLKQLANVAAPDGRLSRGLDSERQITDDSQSDGTTQRALDLVRDLAAVLETVAKKDVLADLGRLALFLERHPVTPIARLFEKLSAPAVPPADLVATYTERLKSLFGDDGFAEALAEALKDKRLKQAEFAAIAVGMGNKISPRMPKTKIAEHLLALHRNLATFKAKQRAMAGRSAA